MDIMNVAFEESLMMTINGEVVKVIPFRTQEEGNIKFGIQAPRSVKVHREEIHHAIKEKEKATEKN